MRGAFAAEHCRTLGEMMMTQDLSKLGSSATTVSRSSLCCVPTN